MGNITYCDWTYLSASWHNTITQKVTSNKMEITCKGCNSQIDSGSRFCSKCGTATQATGEAERSPSDPGSLVYPPNPPRSEWLCLCSLILPGSAQLIYGQTAKGLLVCFVSIWLGFGWVTFGIVNIIMAIDAYHIGKALKLGKTIGKWAWFPR